MGLTQKWFPGLYDAILCYAIQFLISAWDINENAFMSMYMFSSEQW